MKSMMNSALIKYSYTGLLAFIMSACASQKTGDVTLDDEPLRTDPVSYQGSSRTEGVRMDSHERNPAITAVDTGVDNSAPNARLRRPSIVLSEDQATESPKDSELSRRIREEISKDKAISSYGRNITISTVEGTTTLRGPVRSLAEKRRVLSAASRVNGANAISDHIHVLSR